MTISEKITGADISTLAEEERCGAKYYDCGREGDALEILRANGVNSVRLRLWNDPYGPADALGARPAYGAGTNDLAVTMQLARRAKALGMSVLLDFHYSDFWADPGKQYPPKAWAAFGPDELVSAVRCYTKNVLLKMKEQDLLPDYVQVGNELTNGTCWPLGNRDYDASIGTCRWMAGIKEESVNYFNPILIRLLNAGISAVREVSPGLPVMLHLDNGGNNALYRSWFDGWFDGGGADFDIIGLSYYPFWHGRLSALKANMDDLALRYGKELVIAEVSMGHSMEDYRAYELTGKAQPDGLKGMATRLELTKDLDYPMTPEGQRDFMLEINRISDSVPDGLGRGFYYWEPAWIPVPGCGWATPASLEYIHDRGPCGNEWANQALFDYCGNALPALHSIRGQV